MTPFAVDDRNSLNSLNITMKYRVGGLQTCTHRSQAEVTGHRLGLYKPNNYSDPLSTVPESELVFLEKHGSVDSNLDTECQLWRFGRNEFIEEWIFGYNENAVVYSEIRTNLNTREFGSESLAQQGTRLSFSDLQQLVGLQSTRILDEPSKISSLGAVFLNLTSRSCNLSVVLDDQISNHTELIDSRHITRSLFNKLFAIGQTNILSVWELGVFTFVLLLQISFIFLESGLVSEKTTQTVLNKSTFNFVVSALTFYAFGFGFSDKAYGGFIGAQNFFARDLRNITILKLMY